VAVGGGAEESAAERILLFLGFSPFDGVERAGFASEAGTGRL
jgi:hypothetical protein